MRQQLLFSNVCTWRFKRTGQFLGGKIIYNLLLRYNVYIELLYNNVCLGRVAIYFAINYIYIELL